MTTTAVETVLTYPADETWQGFVGTHGGVLVSALLAAARECVPGLPAAVTTHFLAPVPPGDLRVEAAALHPGRTASVTARIGTAVTALIRMIRDPQPTATSATSATAATGTAGTAGTTGATPAGPAPGWPPPPRAAAPGELPVLELPRQLVPIAQHLEIRPVSATRPLAGGDDPAFDVWIRLRPAVFRTRTFSNHEAAAILLDALPPGLFATMSAPPAIPTAELTAHFTPASYRPDDWFRVRQRTAWASGTLCVDETELRTATGTLAAQARQLRKIHSPG